MRSVATRYARSRDARIAYQVIGQGSLDLVFLAGLRSNLDILWEDPGYVRLMNRLAVFGRLLLLDERGTGLSDGLAGALPELDARAADVLAVMDAAGAGRAALIGASDGAALAILLATDRPDRVRSLVLCGGYARFQDEVMDGRRLKTHLAAVDADWGSGATLAQLAPSRATDRRFAQWWARFERLQASPTAALAQARMTGAIDVRHRLGAVAAPTLVLHRAEDAHVPPDCGRRLARAIPGARFVQLPGRDHPIWMGDVDRTADTIEEFLTGHCRLPDRGRVLAVVLVARLTGRSGRVMPGGDDPHPGERTELFHDALPAVMERFGGQAEWSGHECFVARFEGLARAARGAVALGELAASVGLGIAQAIHVGEIDVMQVPLAGQTVDIADRIAAAARPGDILVSRVASDLVSGSGFGFVDHGSVAVDGLDEAVAVRALAIERHLEPHAPKPHGADLGALSPREREVLGMVADGLSNTRIAVDLGLSEHTVKRHVANILLKLDQPTRTAAARLVARDASG